MIKNYEIILGDAEEVLSNHGDETFDCIVTSPPYFGLRNYGIGGQIGLEDNPDAYISRLVATFRQCHRTLKKTGTLWLNIGDSYYNHRPGKGQALSKQTMANSERDLPSSCPRRNNKFEGLKEKDLIGIPWMLAFALRADGWYLRQDIIWHKTNTMPESVRDRCTKSHEYLFLLTKSKCYYFDNQSIREANQDSYGGKRGIIKHRYKTQSSMGDSTSDRNQMNKYAFGGRNKRSVWSVPTRPFKGAHFATFPTGLIEPCIKAGCPEGGIVVDPFCGSGTVGVVALEHKRQFLGIDLKPDYAEMAKARIEKSIRKILC